MRECAIGMPARAYYEIWTGRCVIMYETTRGAVFFVLRTMGFHLFWKGINDNYAFLLLYFNPQMCWENWAKKITHFFSWDFIRGQLSASSGNEFPLVSFTVSLRVAACVRQGPRIGIRRNVTMIVTPRASILRRHLTSLDSV